VTGRAAALPGAIECPACGDRRSRAPVEAYLARDGRWRCQIGPCSDCGAILVRSSPDGPIEAYQVARRAAGLRREEVTL